MFRKHTKQPQDAIAALLQKYNYGDDNIEKFIDACVSYQLLVSPTLKNQVIHDPAAVEIYRLKYLAEFEKSVTHLQKFQLEDREKIAFEHATKVISAALQDKQSPAPQQLQNPN